MHISDFVDNWFHALMIKSPSNYVFIPTGARAMHYFMLFHCVPLTVGGR